MIFLHTVISRFNNLYFNLIQYFISGHIHPFGWLLFLVLAGNVPQSMSVISLTSAVALSQYSVHWDIPKIEPRDRLKGVGEISLEWLKTPWIDESHSSKSF